MTTNPSQFISEQIDLNTHIMWFEKSNKYIVVNDLLNNLILNRIDNDKFPINSLYLMRGYLFVNDDKKDKYFDLCFDAYWKNNEDISKEETIKNILSKCEIKTTDFETGIKDQKIKDELKDLTNIAFQNDIFGAPTFVVNGNLFWGQDRLEYALDELNI